MIVHCTRRRWRSLTPRSDDGGMIRTLTLAAATLLLTACGSSPEPVTSTSSAPAMGLANPASVYCASIGGTVEIQDTDAGQVGMCKLPDGRLIDEWELYRSDHPTPSATS